jgi:hypothetical protein
MALPVQSGPGRSLPRIRPPTRATGITPPAVVAANTSSASSSIARGMGAMSAGMPSIAQSSSTDLRVMPCRLPRSGVSTTPSFTTKMLKPGPSVTKPSASHRIAVSKP